MRGGNRVFIRPAMKTIVRTGTKSIAVAPCAALFCICLRIFVDMSEHGAMVDRNRYRQFYGMGFFLQAYRVSLGKGPAISGALCLILIDRNQ
ncbi:hypothetical protein BJF93_20390 [Xaviernesmea oryzae]|uniref:Uncharacterized protein n=1 Tax=Xaviernesmea oryzae TaxID=464029 RepID=A0A1Q9AVV9_9HYPH|nr:hypothetical protein BJF93_20390 [Xaviernesmea oryzae]